MAAYADGVIVGSALVRTLSGPGELGDRLDALRALTTELADGVRTRRDEHRRWTARPRSSPTTQPSTGPRARARRRRARWPGSSSAWCSIYAGATKVGHPLTAQRAVQAYEIFPDGLANTIGLALPFLEIILGVLLVLGLFTRPAAIASTLLMVAFIIGISQAWARGLTIDCGCFGGGGADRRRPRPSTRRRSPATSSSPSPGRGCGGARAPSPRSTAILFGH